MTGRATARQNPLPQQSLILMMIWLWTAPASAQDLVADLSDHLIAISTSFTGQDVIVFGAVSGGGDVAVTVTGPPESIRVRQKQRVAGIWVNQRDRLFPNVPGFFAFASNRPLAELADETVRSRHALGLDVLELSGEAQDLAERRTYRAALIREKKRQGLYQTERIPIAFLGQRLFRATVSFPAEVPVGQYSANVYLLRDGQVVSATTTPLVVSKIGVSARMFDFAQRQGFLYGVLSLIVAVFAGWAAAALFRRR
ncbi:MAG: TIGR02186 family protein [Pseudomonadota bacterium]